MTTVVHLKRKGGVEVVSCDVYIGRGMYQGGWHLPASKWMNPFKLAKDGSNRAEVLARYRDHVESSPALMAALPELAGKRLGCWCVGPKCPTCGAATPRAGVAPSPCGHLQCHGEVLQELLNGSTASSSGN